MNNKSTKIIGTILGIISFIALIAGITYAWVSWQSENTTLSGQSRCFPNINYTNGTTLSTDNILLYDEDSIIKNNKLLLKENMIYLDITASIDNSCNTRVALDIEINIKKLNSTFINGTSTGAFKYALISYDPNAISDLSDLENTYLDIIENNSINNTGIFNISANEITTTNKGYLLIFYVDGDIATNDAENTEFTISITGKGTQIES